MLKINKITIKNFRSISNLSIDCSEITCFVGNNDAGKSNVLRALNLFFNGHTDYLQPFDFDRDFNKFSVTPKQKAKEIIVELLIELPLSYRRYGYPNEILWKRVWRKGGYSAENSSRFYVGKVEIPSRSKVPLLLDRVEYKYIPAIKDKTFFADLQGQLYDVLSQVADEDLRNSASKFETEIQGQIKGLLSSVSNVFKSDSSMKLPENLRQIFENLEFNNSDGIPLSRRGDGIKVRHIPAILRFIADKTNSIHKQGVIYHVWGFEEPENNVEMAASFDMVAEFIEAAQHEHQIFLTTHSPVFYGEAERNSALATVYRVSKSSQISEIKPAQRETTDSDLGLAQVIAPYVAEERSKWQGRQLSLEQQLTSLKALSDQEKKTRRIFVEGKTDVKVIEKFISVFYPDLVGSFKLECGGHEAYGSAEAASHRAAAWQLNQSHEKTPVKAVLLLDKDEAGQKARDSFKAAIGEPSNSYVKPSFWEVSSMPAGLDDGFNLPIDLEFLYSDEVWEHADSQGWLEARDVSEHISPELQKKINDEKIGVGQQFELFGNVSSVVKLRVQKKFSVSGKESASKWICTLPDKDVKKRLESMDRSIKSALNHLGISVGN